MRVDYYQVIFLTITLAAQLYIVGGLNQIIVHLVAKV